MNYQALAETIYVSLGTASISMTLAWAKVFKGWRETVKQRSEWWGELVSCPYCTSHYVAAALVLLVHHFPVQVTFEGGPPALRVPALILATLASYVVAVFATITLNVVFQWVIKTSYLKSSLESVIEERVQEEVAFEFSRRTQALISRKRESSLATADSTAEA